MILDLICYAADQEKDPGEIFSDVSRIIRNMIPGVFWFGIFAADLPRHSLVLGGCSGPEPYNRRFPFGRYTEGRAAVTQQVICLDHIPENESKPSLCTGRFKLVVPVISKGKFFGVLSAHSSRKETFIEEEIFIIEDTGDIIADRLEQASRLLHE
jgi:putative methionine-R-sulfoxide reductase with GAF domain